MVDLEVDASPWGRRKKSKILLKSRALASKGDYMETIGGLRGDEGGGRGGGRRGGSAPHGEGEKKQNFARVSRPCFYRETIGGL